MLWLILSACSGREPARTVDLPVELSCTLQAEPTERDGQRRLAMLVGVADYADDTISDLSGPPKDLSAMHWVLVKRLGVPAENICVLQDERATLPEVEQAFQEHLIDQARPGDRAFFYFSGHGSQTLDWDREETDGYDEQLLLHDYAPGGEGGALLDDRLGTMVGALHEAMSGDGEAPDITLIFDACFSGTATRGGGDFVVRQVPPTTTGWIRTEPAGAGDTELSGGLDGVVVLAASRDDTVALEPASGSGGLFTQSLTAALHQGADVSTWRQIAHHTARQLEARLENSTLEQRPTFQGPLERRVLGGEPVLSTGWEVSQLEPLTLSGLALPGWGVGAVVAIIPADAAPASIAAGAVGGVEAKLTAFEGFQAAAVPLDAGEAASIRIGDKAVLLQAADGDAQLPVTFALAEAAALQEQTAAFAEPAEAGLMTVSDAPDGQLHIQDADGRIRNRAADLDEAARWLSLHAQQHTLRQQAARLRSGELSVQAVPYPRHSTCGEEDWWEPCSDSGVQVLPACALWQLEVESQALYDTHYQVGGVLLASDGCILGFPEAEKHTTVRASTTTRIDPDWAMVAENTGAAPHELLLFGYPADATLPVPWSALTTDCTEGPPPLLSGRGGGGLPPAWTATTLSLAVSANPALHPDACPATSCTEADAAAPVDVRPFLPPAPHPLREVLLGLSQDGGEVSAVLGEALGGDLAALPACDCAEDDHPGVTLHPGDVVTFEDGASALVVSSTIPLLWGAGGFAVLDRRQHAVQTCQRPDWPAPTAPEPMACYCCEAP